jgi:hypothetical protein
MRSLNSIKSFISLSVLFIYPYRGSTKGPNPALIGVGLAILIGITLLLARHFGFVS